MAFAGYDMLTSVEDLIGRMVVASERKVSQSAEPDRALLTLGFPYPSQATNDQLSMLQPFYIKLLQNIEEKVQGDDDEDESSSSISIINRLNKSEDDAMFLLYVLEFPLLVLTARKDTSGIANCYVEESYEILDIAKRIIRNKSLLVWCRNVITNNRQYNCMSIIASAVSFLATISPENGLLSSSKMKKIVQKYVFEGKDNKEGFRVLRENLADVVSRNDATHFVVANSILMQTHILWNIYDGDEQCIYTQMSRASHKGSFTTALIRVKDKFDKNLFQKLLLMIDDSQFSSTQYQGDHILQTLQTAEEEDVPYQNRNKNNSVFVCDRKGCTNPGSKRCMRCLLVGYCSKDCQTASWKVHKKICTPKKLNTKKVVAAAEVARQAPNPALVQQDYLLKQNPNVDYVIVMPSGNKDTGCQIEHPMGKMMFRYFRTIAPTSPGAVFRLYDWLRSTHPKHEIIIRKQLMAEYGIDPLSDIAKNDKIPELNKEDMISQLM